MERKLMALGACHEMIAYDIVEESLTFFKRNAEGVVKTVIVDLNFIELPKETFDLVFVWESMHHVINIEYLLFQIALSLKTDGILIIRDFMGETRWQWGSIKRKSLNNLIRKIQNDVEGAPVMPLDRWAGFMSPFESIRSGEIDNLIHSIFGETVIFKKQWESLCHDAFGILDYRRSGEKLDQAIQILIEADRQLEEDSPLKPCTLFGIYKKPTFIRPPSVEPWSFFKKWKQLDNIQYLDPRIRWIQRAKKIAFGLPGGKLVWKILSKTVRK